MCKQCELWKELFLSTSDTLKEAWECWGKLQEDKVFLRDKQEQADEEVNKEYWRKEYERKLYWFGGNKEKTINYLKKMECPYV